MPRSAASDLDLHCLPRSQKRDGRLIWVNIVTEAPVFNEFWFNTISVSYVVSDLGLHYYCLPSSLVWANSWQNQQNDSCAQQRLGSAWAFAQSDQSLHCPHEETLGPQLPIECTVKTGCPGWSESSLSAHHFGFVGFVKRRLIWDVRHIFLAMAITGCQ